ncbi:MAG TPA: hypothetical protein VM537_00370, partial [Anaerolineae bacterium]|nr:hypothetical protein [Anaerolineae bacterium]
QVNLGPAYRQIRDLAIVRSADGASIFVGAAGTTRYPRSFVYRSEDNGVTWQESQALEYGQSPGSIITDLVPDPMVGERLYLPTYGGLFFSEDSGQTWHGAALPSCREGRKAVVVEGDSALAGRLYATCALDGPVPQTQLLRSDDGARTWQQLSHPPLPGQARGMAVLPGTPSTLLLATDRGLYRSGNGGRSWTDLGSGKEASGATALLAGPNGGARCFATTGHGFYVSHDAGDHWEMRSDGLPPNGRLRVLATSATQAGVVLGGLEWDSSAEGYWMVSILRSDDGGQSWRTLATGPWDEIRALAIHPQRPDHLLAATSVAVVQSRDGGETWTEVPLDDHPVQALAFDLEDVDTLYAGLYSGGVYASDDGGVTWTPRGLQSLNINDLTVAGAGDLFAATSGYPEEQGGLYRSIDHGQSWERLTSAESGMETVSVRSVVVDVHEPDTLFVLAADSGVYRSTDRGGSWSRADGGLPETGDILELLQQPDGTLWASRDGGGIYRSEDRGKLWENVGGGLGDNLVLALAQERGEDAGLIAATSTAGLFALDLGQEPDQPVPPGAVDGRVEIVWPHDGAAVGEAEQANLGLRLFWPGSLVPPPCDWTPQVDVWQAVDTGPARRLGTTDQRSVEGRPFPFWELNDVDVSAAQDSETKLYFLVRVVGVDTATSIWAHGADARTHFPVQDTPDGVFTGQARALEARIQIVWPHDGVGREQLVAEADWANVSVAFFEPGSNSSVGPEWEPQDITLFGAWNQSIGRPLATQAEKRLESRGSVTFPVWDFNNVDVRAAQDPSNRLYLWVELEGVTTYPTIWAHGVDARTRFPVEDEPITGCGAPAPLSLTAAPSTDVEAGAAYVGDVADILQEALADLPPEIPDAQSGASRVPEEAAEALRSLLVSTKRGLLYQRPATEGAGYIYLAEGSGSVLAGALGGRAYLFWQQDGELWQQWWTNDSDIGDALRQAPGIIRVVEGKQGLELGIAGDILAGRSWAHFHLLRLNSSVETAGTSVAGHWEPVWSWHDAPPATWSGQEGRLTLLDEGLDRLRLTGPMPPEFENGPRIFAEVDDYSKQRVSSIWDRQGESYLRGTMVLQSTPMTVLSRFILALREGDLDSASQLVGEGAIVEEALSHGWSLPRPEGDRLLAMGGY